MRLFQGPENGRSHHQVEDDQKKDGGHRLPFHHRGNHLQYFKRSVNQHVHVKEGNERKRDGDLMASHLALLSWSQRDGLCGEGEAGLGVVSGRFGVQ